MTRRCDGCLIWLQVNHTMVPQLSPLESLAFRMCVWPGWLCVVRMALRECWEKEYAETREAKARFMLLSCSHRSGPYGDTTAETPVAEYGGSVRLQYFAPHWNDWPMVVGAECSGVQRMTLLPLAQRHAPFCWPEKQKNHERRRRIESASHRMSPSICSLPNRT